MAPRVVVTGSHKQNRTSWLFLRLILSYYKVQPIFVDEESPLPQEFDGLIISGGVDLCPSSYGSTLHLPCNEKRDRMEFNLLEMAYAKRRPTLGICRGMQLINAFFGGTLHEEIATLELAHPHPRSPFPINTITIKPATKLRAILGTSTLKVNALHHQSIKNLGKELIINAYDTNGLVQGIEHETLFCIGVQWHPEYLPYSAMQRRLFKSFVNEISL